MVLKKENIKPSGRPLFPLDWDRVDYLFEAGCTGKEIALSFGMHYNTFVRRFEKEFGTNMTTYEAARRKVGEQNLHEAQYKKALSGDNTMLIWLGKQRLNQREPDNTVNVVTQEMREKLDQHQQQMRESIELVRSLQGKVDPSAIREALDPRVEPVASAETATSDLKPLSQL